MLKVFGWLLIAFGTLLCFTIIFSVVGIWLIGVGGVLLIAHALQSRSRRERELERELEYRTARTALSPDGGEDAVQRDLRERRVSGSMFGR